MKDGGTSQPGRAARPEPSWATVIATTARLWFERHPVVVGRKAVHLSPLLALARVVERAGLERAGLAGPDRDQVPAAPRTPRGRLAVLAVLAGALVLGA